MPIAARKHSLGTLEAEDPKVYDMICAADTVGVFQIESRAQMAMLPRLKPRCYYDLVIEVAIVRPGPIQGDMVHPYLRRRMGQEKVEYPGEEVREVLHRTLGVPLFQEQVMQIAIVAAGFSPGRPMRCAGPWGRGSGTGGLDPFRERLLQGMARKLSGRIRRAHLPADARVRRIRLPGKSQFELRTAGV